MPGYRNQQERTEQIILRVTPREKLDWTKYAEGGGLYLSELIRALLRDHILSHPDPRKGAPSRWTHSDR